MGIVAGQENGSTITIAAIRKKSCLCISSLGCGTRVLKGTGYCSSNPWVWQQASFLEYFKAVKQ